MRLPYNGCLERGDEERSIDQDFLHVVGRALRLPA